MLRGSAPHRKIVPDRLLDAAKRVAPELAHLERAHKLYEYRFANGINKGHIDDAVLADLRDPLVRDFADALPANRDVN